jgi:hypothetical protein
VPDLGTDPPHPIGGVRRHHGLPYLREAPGSLAKFSPDGETVITGIEVKDVTPRQE